MLKCFSSKSSFVSSYEYAFSAKSFAPIGILQSENRAPATGSNNSRKTLSRSFSLSLLSEVHPRSLKHPPNPSIVWAVADRSTFRFKASHRQPEGASACACHGVPAVVVIQLASSAEKGGDCAPTVLGIPTIVAPAKADPAPCKNCRRLHAIFISFGKHIAPCRRSHLEWLTMTLAAVQTTLTSASSLRPRS